MGKGGGMLQLQHPIHQHFLVKRVIPKLNLVQEAHLVDYQATVQVELNPNTELDDVITVINTSHLVCSRDLKAAACE